MVYIGLRFTNKEYSCVVIDGDFTNPTIVSKATVKFPKNFSRPKCLDWLHKELESLISGRAIEKISIKGMEPFASKNGTPALHRLENEAIAFLVAGQNGVEIVERVVDATVASRLGLEAKYKRRQSYESCDEKFEETMDEKTKDALLAAWVKMT